MVVQGYGEFLRFGGFVRVVLLLFEFVHDAFGLVRQFRALFVDCFLDLGRVLVDGVLCLLDGLGDLLGIQCFGEYETC